jgi:hypothetical protein
VFLFGVTNNKQPYKMENHQRELAAHEYVDGGGNIQSIFSEWNVRTVVYSSDDDIKLAMNRGHGDIGFSADIDMINAIREHVLISLAGLGRTDMCMWVLKFHPIEYVYVIVEALCLAVKARKMATFTAILAAWRDNLGSYVMCKVAEYVVFCDYDDTCEALEIMMRHGYDPYYDLGIKLSRDLHPYLNRMATVKFLAERWGVNMELFLYYHRIPSSTWKLRQHDYPVVAYIQGAAADHRARERWLPCILITAPVQGLTTAPALPRIILDCVLTYVRGANFKSACDVYGEPMGRSLWDHLNKCHARGDHV